MNQDTEAAMNEYWAAADQKDVRNLGIEEVKTRLLREIGYIYEDIEEIASYFKLHQARAKLLGIALD